MKIFVTGGAGFIGSHLVDRLLAEGHHVTAYDDLSSGRSPFLQAAQQNPHFLMIEGDILDADRLTACMSKHELVFHLAANSDPRAGAQHPRKDLDLNTVGTWQVLEAMRANDIERLVFTSTAAVYGDVTATPTPEDAPFPVQSSLYAASKLAGEALVSAYCAGFGLQAFIFRTVSILGERYTRGQIVEVFEQLQEHPDALRVGGDGHQAKSYLYVHDCIDAMLVALQRARARVNILNLDSDEVVEFDESISEIVGELGLSPARTYAGGGRAWGGDSPAIHLDCSRMRALGWSPKLSVPQSVRRTVRWLRDNPWVHEARR